MSKSSLSLAAQDPILLDKCHYLTRLIVTNAYVHVLHNGVKEILTELCSELSVKETTICQKGNS